MNKETFIEELAKLDIILDNEQLAKLEKYYELLVKENKKYNLTSIINKKDVYLKHFYDSLTLIKIIKLNNQSLCDIGTGAGFPGIVLKIVFPNIQLTLIEATSKKCDFLKLVINNLELKNVQIINNRVEEYSINNREKYDIVVSRAMANLKVLLEIVTPLIKIDGYFVAMKGKIQEELNNLNNYEIKLDIELLKKEEFFLPIENSNRILLLFRKIEETNKIYPRRYSEILKKEL